MTSIPVAKEDVNSSSINGDSVHQYDVIIIGAGFSGVSNLHRLRNDGLKCHVFEAGMSPFPRFTSYQTPSLFFDAIST
jgi:ribulose 1,5-bisphosphate synthetase/thiazole synthase